MRVALLSATPPTANPYIGLLRDGIASAGVQVDLLTEPGQSGLPDQARQADVVHLHWLELWARPDYLNLAGLASLGQVGRGLRRLLTPRLNSPAVYAWRRRRALQRFLDELARYQAGGGRIVYTVHNLGQHEGEAEAVESAGLRLLLALADAVHVHNEFMADAVTALRPGLDDGHHSGSWKKWGRGRTRTDADQKGKIRVHPSSSASHHSDLRRLVMIPHGHYIDAYPNQIGRDEARRRLDVPASSFVTLFLGLIRPYKGLEELLPAFRSLDNLDTLLLIAGRSRPHDYAARLARESGAAADSRVRWHPHFVPGEEVQLWMNAADIVVLPYRHVSSSGAALLAFSFAKPIIAPALPAFRELLAGNDFLGLLYDPADPAGLASALRQARSIDWSACREEILAWVRQFDWQSIGQQFAALYAEVIGDR